MQVDVQTFQKDTIQYIKMKNYENKLVQSSLFVPFSGPRSVITLAVDESSVCKSECFQMISRNFDQRTLKLRV